MGLGSSLRPRLRARNVVSDRGKGVLKLEGTKGSRLSFRCLLSYPSRFSCPGPLRQCHYHSLPKQTGGYKKQNTSVASFKDPGLGRKACSVLISSPPQRHLKCSGRLSKQKADSGVRMEPESGNLCNDYQGLGSTANRPICVTGKYTTPSIFLYSQKRQGPGDRCVNPALELPSGLRISSFPTYPVGVKEDTEGEGGSNPNYSILAKEGMVFHHSTDGSQTILAAASPAGPAPTGSNTASGSGQSKPHGLVSEEQLLRNKGLSQPLVTTLLSSRKIVTRKIYAKYWKVFNSFCHLTKRKVKNLVSILEFLQEGADKGLSVSTLKVQVAALGVFLERPISSEPLVIRFFKALTRSRPAPAKHFPNWDLSVVLQALTKEPFEPLQRISLRNLTLKTLFLVAITSARRIGELHALSVKRPFLTIYTDRIVLKTDPGFLPKVASAHNRSQEIILPTFCSNPSGEKEGKFHNLDVRRTLLQYLEVTSNFRSSDSLFILFSGKKKGQQASKGSIARWLKSAILAAYSQSGLSPPLGIKAHSTRAQATTWAEMAGATPDQICRAATWSSYLTFVRHYRLDLLSASEQAFGRKVLQAVVPP